MPKAGACCLASLNLSEFVDHPYTSNAYFKSAEFVQAVKIGIRTLDILIDENADKHPLPQQREMSLNYRNIGLGVFGYATMLFKLGMEYGSDEAIIFTDSLFDLMFKAAVIESNERAKELGTFPKYKECVFNSDIMESHFSKTEIEEMRPYGLRNCSLISIAPTGSIATMLGESGGCEPEFAIKYTRRTVGMTEGEDTYYDIYCKGAREYMEVNNTDTLPDYFVSSHDIPWRNRIATQAIMQRHVDTAISSTVNLPNNTTVEEVEQLYLEAWKNNLKGVTIFRDGCKRMPILSTEKEKNDIRKVGKIRKLTTGCGSLHLTAFFNSQTGDLMDVFLNKGSTGGCNIFMICASRLISELSHNCVDIHKILEQLNSCGVCSSYAVRTATKHDTSPGSSCPVAVGKALKEMWEEMQNEIASDKKTVETKKISRTDTKSGEYDGKTCPVCHSPIDHVGGCDQCSNCGWSKCE